MKQTPETTNLLLSYIVLQDLLGARPFRWFDSKGGEMWIKIRYFSQGGEAYPKGGEMPKWIKSTYEEGVAR